MTEQLAFDLSVPVPLVPWDAADLARLCFECAQHVEGDGGTRQGDPDRARERGRIVHAARAACPAHEVTT